MSVIGLIGVGKSGVWDIVSVSAEIITCNTARGRNSLTMSNTTGFEIVGNGADDGIEKGVW